MRSPLSLWLDTLEMPAHGSVWVESGMLLLSTAPAVDNNGQVTDPNSCDGIGAFVNEVLCLVCVYGISPFHPSRRHCLGQTGTVHQSRLRSKFIVTSAAYVRLHLCLWMNCAWVFVLFCLLGSGKNKNTHLSLKPQKWCNLNHKVLICR